MSDDTNALALARQKVQNGLSTNLIDFKAHGRGEAVRLPEEPAPDHSSSNREQAR